MSAITRPSIPWTLVASGHAGVVDAPLNRRRLVLRVLALGLVVAVVVTLAAGLVARQIAQTTAVDSAVQRTRILALDVVQPSLGNGVVDGDAAAIARLGDIVRSRVLASDVVRVKIWRADGKILYSDEPRLIGRTFPLGDDDRDVLRSSGTHSKISDLTDADDLYERGHGPLLEISRSIRTPNTTPLLFEIYFNYGAVKASQNGLWLRFAAVTAGSLVLLLLGLAPVLRSLTRSLDRASEQREVLLQRAIDSSDHERRRIAALLHDGPVQELVGASYFIGAAGFRAEGSDAKRTLEQAENTVRATVDALRTLLIDIYPPALAESGLESALITLAHSSGARGSTVRVEVERDVRLSARVEQLVFRVAREALANAVKHGEGKPVTVIVAKEHRQTILTISDDGPGFDAEALVAEPRGAHFGLRLLRDAVDESGLDATLAVRSAAGAGTVWRLTVLG